jgi:mannose-6-phosphate isomerase-like protein (cupin superfamily)
MMFSSESELACDIKLCVEKSLEMSSKNHNLNNNLYSELMNAFSGINKNHFDCGEHVVHQKSYITLDKSEINEIYHPGFIKGFRLPCSLAEATVKPGECTENHIHKESTEIYYGLEGSGTLYLDCIEGGKMKFCSGSSALIPPGIPHYICADAGVGAKSLKFLCYCTPPYSHEQTEIIR